MSNHQPNNFSLDDDENNAPAQQPNNRSPPRQNENNNDPIIQRMNDLNNNSPNQMVNENNNNNNQQQQQRDPNDIGEGDDSDQNDPNNINENGQNNNAPIVEDSNAPVQPQRQEEEKKDAKEDKRMASTTSNYIDKNKFVSQQRSNLMTMNDRHQLEKDILKQIESGSGILGTSKIDLDARKKEAFKHRNDQKLPQNDELVKLLQSDGLYVDSALLFKNKDINVQKLEERLLNNGQRDYFKLNGQIKINNDVLADELTRPADLAFEQTDAFQTVENNAIVTDRLNSFKKQYYRIDIIVGKIVLKEFQTMFDEEDHHILNLRTLCKHYDRRVSLALIPFYLEKKDYLEEQIAQKENDANVSFKDIEFLRQMKDNIEKDLEFEKKAVNEAADEIYTLWRKIRSIQQNNNEEIKNPYELKVHPGNDGQDILFNVNDKGIESSQKMLTAKKNKLMKITGYCRLIIDGKFVSQTQKVNMTWPNSELEILDQFQIHVFTLPSSVKLEIMINDKLVDIIDLIIPGSHVKTLTSASRLIKEYEFSRKNYFIAQRKKRGVDLEKDVNLMTADEKSALKRDIPRIEKVNVEGQLFVKAEWEGFGDQMPPAKSETLFQLNQVEKNRNYFTKQEQFSMLQEQKPLDVNDPRNELIIKHMRNMKNDYLDKLLSLDSKFQLHDTNSFRNMLLEARSLDPNYAKITIPQLNSEIINGDICKFYVDWLEEVHRQQTYKAYLAQKQQIQQNLMEEENYQLENSNNFDDETLKRRQEIFDKINKRKKQVATGNTSNKQANYETVISEFTLNDAENQLLTLIKNMFQFERKLKPKIKKRKTCAVESVAEAKLLIHVIRGTDVPVRQSYYQDFLGYIQNLRSGGQDQQKAYQELYHLKQVETFLEVRVHDPETGKDQIQKTCVSEGQCPEWNEMLEFVLTAKNKLAFAKHELEQSKLMVYFTLFDQEVKVDQITHLRQMRYIQNRYLGSFKIPLTTILGGTKFEGLIRLDRPLVLQDYHVIQDELIFKDAKDMAEQQARNEEQIPTYINLSVTLEPLIQIQLENDKDFYAGKERTEFLAACCAWAQQVTKKYVLAPRYVKLFLENIDGQSIFLPKFLTPIRPPDEIYTKADTRAIERAARFVSLIPYIDDSQLFKDMPDLTCTCQEFLDLGQGDSEEHAMLLCNYFNFIDRDQGNQRLNADAKTGNHYVSYIVYGDALPDGVCWYVLRRDCEKNFVELWNPMSAEVFNFDLISSPTRQVFGSGKSESMNQRAADPQCTMRKIWCIVGQENVFANIQKEEQPVMLNFNLDDTKQWKPFLDKKLRQTHFAGGSVQAAHVQGESAPLVKYTKPKPNLGQLEEQIKKYLAGKFEDERIATVKKTTNWNIQVGEQLKKILEADDELNNEYKGDVKSNLDPKNQQKSKRGGYGDFNPTEVVYKKYFISENIGKILRDFEDYMACARKGGTIARMRNKEQNKNEDIRASIVQEYLKEIASRVGKTCWAIPINTSLVNLDAVWELVRNTRMHEIDNQDIEFSLSVTLKAYPCNIISVWIYIATFKDQVDENY